MMRSHINTRILAQWVRIFYESNLWFRRISRMWFLLRLSILFVAWYAVSSYTIFYITLPLTVKIVTPRSAYTLFLLYFVSSLLKRSDHMVYFSCICCDVGVTYPIFLRVYRPKIASMVWRILDIRIFFKNRKY